MSLKPKQRRNLEAFIRNTGEILTSDFTKAVDNANGTVITTRNGTTVQLDGIRACLGNGKTIKPRIASREVKGIAKAALEIG